MKMGKSLRLALAGCGLLAVAPVARADEDASLQDRIRELEKTVLELKDQISKQQSAEPLSVQVERYLQESEKGSLWTDMGGKPLDKAINSAWIHMMLRVRPMWSKNLFDFTDGVDDEGFMTLTRDKIGVGAKLHDDMAAYLELDMDGSWGNASSVSGNDGGFTVTPRMQQAYMEGLYSKQLGWKTRVGRWEMEYGDGYIIGDRDFTQAGLAFDGVRLSKNWEGGKSSWDIIGSKLVDGYKNGLTATPDDSVYMFALYGNYYGFEGSTGMPGGFEPYYILVKNQADVPGAAGKMRDIHTLGAYWYGDKATKDRGGIGWNVNLDGQYNNDLFWATDSRLMYTMSQTKWTPKVFGQFAYASGDHDMPGGAGYNPLWQDAHGRFGYSDLFGFTNLMVFGIGCHVTPKAGLSYGLEFRSDHIARNYTGGGKGKNLAWETDFIVKHKYSENVNIEAAYALVHWRDSMNTGGADDVQVAYFNVVLSF